MVLLLLVVSYTAITVVTICAGRVQTTAQPERDRQGEHPPRNVL